VSSTTADGLVAAHAHFHSLLKPANVKVKLSNAELYTEEARQCSPRTATGRLADSGTGVRPAPGHGRLALVVAKSLTTTSVREYRWSGAPSVVLHGPGARGGVRLEGQEPRHVIILYTHQLTKSEMSLRRAANDAPSLGLGLWRVGLGFLPARLVEELGSFAQASLNLDAFGGTPPPPGTGAGNRVR
jgi:hypothetical protein